MEEVLDVYQRPCDPKVPLVCLDEASKQLLGDKTPPQEARPGQVERVDYQYQRNGTANMFMSYAPLLGERFVDVTDRRTAVDFAYVVKELVDVRYADAEKIVLVMDNLNIRPKGTRAFGAYMKPSSPMKPSAWRTS